MAKRYRYEKRPMILWYGKMYYGAGNLGIAFVSQTMTGFIMFFGTVVCRIPPFLMGLAFSIGVVWDAVTDPLMGYITDNTRSHLVGKRHGYIVAGTFLVALSNVLLWSVPMSADSIQKFLWFLGATILLQTTNTVFSTPYNALGIDLAGDYHEQTTLQTYKSIFFLVGTISPTIIMALLQANPSSGFTDGRLDPKTYLDMAYICSTIMLLCGFISYMGTFSHVPRLIKKEHCKRQMVPAAKSLKEIVGEFFYVLRDRNYSAIILGYAVSMIASAFLTGVGLYMFTYTFKLTSTQMYFLLGALFVSIILSQPLWALLSKKLDKKPSLLLGVGITLAGVAFLFGVFLNLGNVGGQEELMTLLLPTLAFTGIGIGSLYPLPYSMMADTIAYDSVKKNKDRTAMFTGFMTFSFKLSQAATLLIIGIMLELIGFKTDTGADVYVPPYSAEVGLGYLFCVGVAASLICGMILFSRYGLKKSDIPTHEEVRTPSFEVDRLVSVLEMKEKNRKKNNVKD
ncbi:MAG: MFS transporter [Clostridiales bacterium]|jgi:GPH family glycoside/pentoside/hexuronide:cation symporter|nr:MFS transporter [Clostridiales bacterium]